MRTVLNRFIENCESNPDRLAIITKEGEFTYLQFLQIISNVRYEIEKTNGNANRLIGVYTDDDVFTYASILAIMLSGCGYVPLNHKNPDKRNLSLIEETGLKLILMSHESVSMRNIQAIKSHSQLELINTSKVKTAEINYKLPHLEPDYLSYLLFTSGSTGQPKGVPICYGTWNSFMENMLDKEYYNFDEDDRFLQMFELTFDLSVVSMFTPWAIGACVCVVPHHSVFYMWVMKYLESMKITVAVMIPSFLAYLRNYFDEISLPDLRYSIFCGEALPDMLVREWSKCIAHDAIIQNVYGPTEASVYSSIYFWNKEDSERESVNGIVPIGVPFKNMQFYVVNAEKKLAELGEQGELYISGKQVTHNYWKQHSKSDEAFFTFEETGKHTYKTGDIVYLNDQGNYVFIGRIDSQVKVDGYRVELGEIEYYTREFTNQTQVAAIADTNEKGIVSLHLFVQKFNDLEGLQNYLRANLPPFMVPRDIHILDNMPLNLNGKLDRKLLKSNLNHS